MRVRPGTSTVTHPFSSLSMQCSECPCASVAQVTKAPAARDGLEVKMVSPCLDRFTIGVITPFLLDFQTSARSGRAAGGICYDYVSPGSSVCGRPKLISLDPVVCKYAIIATKLNQDIH